MAPKADQKEKGPVRSSVQRHPNPGSQELLLLENPSAVWRADPAVSPISLS